MASFNPYNLFKGNPKILQLIGNLDTPLQQLLKQDSFVSEFKKSENEHLDIYMKHWQYEKLINYVTKIDQSVINDKDKSYRFPFVAADILSTNNQKMIKSLLDDTLYTEQIISQEIQVEKQVDSGSDRSYCSIKSNNSNRSSHKENHSKDYKEFQEGDKQNILLFTNEETTAFDAIQKEDEFINEDDFPDAPQKKIIKVKQFINKTLKVKKMPLIVKLFDYFDGKIIEILDGYVCKILQNVLNNKSKDFFFLLKDNTIFNSFIKILKHIENYSVQQFLLSLFNKMIEHEQHFILQNEIKFIEYLKQQCYLAEKNYRHAVQFYHFYGLLLNNIKSKVIQNKIKRQNIVKEQKITKNSIQFIIQITQLIINKSEIEKFVNQLNSFCLVNGECLQKAQLFAKIINILKNLLLIYVSIKKYLHLQMRLQKQQVQAIKKIVDSCEDSFEGIIKIGLDFIFQGVTLLECMEDLQSFKPKNLLSVKIDILQILETLASEDIYFSKRTIVDSDKFNHLGYLFELYPKSSIFHNSLIKAILPYLISPIQQNKILSKFLEKKDFFNFIYCVIKEDYDLRYQKRQKLRKCYIYHLITICNAIDSLKNQKNEALELFKAREEWQFIKESFLDQEKESSKRSLGGHLKIKLKKPLMTISKVEALQFFNRFLSGSKFSEFQDFDNFEPGNSDSDDEEKQKQAKQIEKITQEFNSRSFQEQENRYFNEDQSF